MHIIREQAYYPPGGTWLVALCGTQLWPIEGYVNPGGSGVDIVKEVNLEPDRLGRNICGNCLGIYKKGDR